LVRKVPSSAPRPSGTNPGNDAAVDWLRGHIAAGDVVLVKASRAAALA
jgi:UDP-N-acetylmuramyl pentapeptide synthase